MKLATIAEIVVLIAITSVVTYALGKDASAQKFERDKAALNQLMDSVKVELSQSKDSLEYYKVAKTEADAKSDSLKTLVDKAKSVVEPQVERVLAMPTPEACLEFTLPRDSIIRQYIRIDSVQVAIIAEKDKSIMALQSSNRILLSDKELLTMALDSSQTIINGIKVPHKAWIVITPGVDIHGKLNVVVGTPIDPLSLATKLGKKLIEVVR